MPDGKPKREQPWAVRGVSMEARSAAAIAARKSGQSLGVWLDRVVRDAATDAIKGAPRQEVVDPTNEEGVRALARDMVAMKTSLDVIGANLDKLAHQKPPPGFTITVPRLFGGKK